MIWKLRGAMDVSGYLKYWHVGKPVDILNSFQRPKQAVGITDFSIAGEINDIIEWSGIWQSATAEFQP